MIRVFVGIKISKGLSGQIKKWMSRHQNLPVRWIGEKNLHITILPPFNIQSNELDSTIGKIAKVVKSKKPFNISFNRISLGPNVRKPRLIWTHGKECKQLNELKKDLDNLNFRKLDRRSLFIHLTIARFNPKDFQSFPQKNLEEEVIWNEKVNSLTIFETRPSQNKAQYKTLHQIEFLNRFHQIGF